MKKREIAIRYSVPQKYDTAPYMTIVKVITGMEEEEEYQHYIQASYDEEKTNWIPMGEFLENALEENFTKKSFLKEISLTYRGELK